MKDNTPLIRIEDTPASNLIVEYIPEVHELVHVISAAGEAFGAGETSQEEYDAVLKAAGLDIGALLFTISYFDQIPTSDQNKETAELLRASLREKISQGILKTFLEDGLND